MNVSKAAIAAVALVAGASFGQPAHGQTVRSTEDFLNTLGVNTHMTGLTASDPWNTNSRQIGEQLNYIGVRLVRDWMWNEKDAQAFMNAWNDWRPDGRFWLSLAEGSPADQRTTLAEAVLFAKEHPGLIYAVGGGNEEDNDYAQKLGATLPDTAVVQAMLYRAMRPLGIKVSQSETGAGWTAANNWEGDYNPNNTGIHQNYTPGPADFGGAHTYLISSGKKMGDTLADLRADARLCTPGKPVAHTEVGAYYDQYKMPSSVFGQSLVMGAFDSFAAGDVGYIVYGLQDTAPEKTYGFFTYPGGIVHPVAVYYHTMTTLLQSAKDGYAPGAKPTFKPDSLNVTFTSGETSHVVMQKPTGEFVIADWSEQLPNESAHEDTDVIDFGRAFKTIAVYDIEAGTTLVDVVHNASRYSLRMQPCDTYLVVLK